MKFRLIAALLATAFMVGCSKCSQQPTPETAPVETAAPPVDTVAPTEGATAESMPNTEQMNEELPPEPAGQ